MKRSVISLTKKNPQKGKDDPNLVLFLNRTKLAVARVKKTA